MKWQISRGGRLFGIAAGLLALACVWRGGWQDFLDILREGAVIAAAAALHEGGHLLAARSAGVRMGLFRLDLFGARMHLSGVVSYGREAWIAAAGPLVNGVSAALVYPLCCRSIPSGGGVLSGAFLFWVASLGLAAINLLPVRSLDGGRILRCLLASIAGEGVADGVVTATTALCLGALWLISVYALLRVGECLGLFAFSLCLIGRMLGAE